jgi:3-oxoacyl-[acyl-carrier protein] reductase
MSSGQEVVGYGVCVPRHRLRHEELDALPTTAGEAGQQAARRGVTIVTGAARGIGLAIAERLGTSGWSVVLADRDGAAARAAAARLRDAGVVAEPAELDVTDVAAAARLRRETLARHGRIDALVNNAGVARDAPLVEMTDDDFRIVVDVCLFGTFCMSREVVPTMIEQGFGRIVNVASRAYLGNPGQANYAAAKAGIVGLTKSLAKELGRYGITANAVAPGVIDTPMVRQHPKYGAILERAKKASSIPRIGRPDEVAEAVAYLCSREAGFITGDVLHVSGGRFG